MSTCEKSNVVILISDILGRTQSILINQQMQAGEYRTELKSDNLQSGIYFYSLSINGKILRTNKMIITK
ncbi:MAG: T9SS type A sorting domain-containing protein [Ignavibacteria bacterium]